MSNKKRISKLLKLKYKEISYFKYTWPEKNSTHFLDTLIQALMKDYPNNFDFEKEYLNFPMPKESITFISEKRFPAIPFDRHLYVF